MLSVMAKLQRAPSSKLGIRCNQGGWNQLHPILILANSGRALAQSAAASGYRVVVADNYGDRETRQAALAWIRIFSGANVGHWRQKIVRFIEAEKYPVGLIFGSGFENRPDIMEELSRRGILLGNTPHCVRLLKDPRRFFPLLGKLTIPAPEVQLQLPDNPLGWLCKAIGGAGGHHIFPATIPNIRRQQLWVRQGWTTAAPVPYYYQRKLEGQPGSVLFLANGKEVQILGYHYLWLAPTPAMPYRYGGIAAPLNLTPSAGALLRNYLQAIVTATGLRGLNGLDFIHGSQGIQVLEINPRPPASLDLYQDRFSPFDAHVKACLGSSLPIQIAPIAVARAFSILYSPHPWRIPPNIVWPAFCTDLPAENTLIKREEPLCSIHAMATSTETCQQLIRRRQNQVLEWLTSSF
ncbi:hypothetical protein NONS58_19650 [Nitrosococcus oceani]|nr:hypothetical protein NONS58_19650 [Nitrosococcus oceani]